MWLYKNISSGKDIKLHTVLVKKKKLTTLKMPRTRESCKLLWKTQKGMRGEGNREEKKREAKQRQMLSTTLDKQVTWQIKG